MPASLLNTTGAGGGAAGLDILRQQLPGFVSRRYGQAFIQQRSSAGIAQQCGCWSMSLNSSR